LNFARKVPHETDLSYRLNSVQKSIREPAKIIPLGTGFYSRASKETALDQNEGEEVRYKREGRPISVVKLAQVLLDLTVENPL